MLNFIVSNEFNIVYYEKGREHSMVVGRLRKTLKQVLAIALAAALLWRLSVPDFSVTAMAEGDSFSEENYFGEGCVKGNREGAQDEESTRQCVDRTEGRTTGTQESDTGSMKTENARRQSIAFRHRNMTRAVR